MESLSIGIRPFIRSIIPMTHGLQFIMKRRRYVILLWTSALTSLFMTLFLIQWNGNKIQSNYVAIFPAELSSECSSPTIDLMDESISEFLFEEPAVDCANGSSPFVQSGLTSLWVTNPHITSCCYQVLNYTTRKNYWYSDDCVEFYPNGMIDDPELEFIRVNCTDDSSTSSYDFHAFVPLKNRKHRKKKKTNVKVSVLILGLDSVSRPNFHRQMPRTLKILQRLEAIEMFGYNKVGDNTFPNLVAALSGLSEEELKKLCWPRKNSYFDECPFIWKNFSNAGYKTMFIEDSPYIGMFEFEKSGFEKSPTDYYLTPFMAAVDEEIGHSGLETANRCAGSRLQIELVLDYVEKFVTTFPNDLYWGLAWSSTLTHDRLNAPQLIDPILTDMLERLYSTKILSNTVLVLMSDHGIRTGKIRSTHQGYLEERLPFLTFVFPEWFKNRYSTAIDVLKQNSARITSPYDLYETLLDLVNLENIGLRSDTTRGKSLFGPTVLSVKRTCHNAGIPKHWCALGCPFEINIEGDEAKNVAKALVEYINEMLKPLESLCSKLELSKIVEVRGRLHESEALGTDLEHVFDYIVTIQTKPGEALFEATVANTSSKLVVERSAISRINLYGNQSACIDDFHMKLFCYCITDSVLNNEINTNKNIEFTEFV